MSWILLNEQRNISLVSSASCRSSRKFFIAAAFDQMGRDDYDGFKPCVIKKLTSP